MRTSTRLAPGLLLLAIAATACTPNDVEVDATYHVWLAANSSASIAEGAVGVGQAPIIDCTLPVEERLEGSMCAPELDEDGYLPYYESELYGYIQPDPQYDGGPRYQGPFSWLIDDAFYLKEDKFEPWRSEAVMTSEGDFQITLHQRLGNGEDFRVAFVIDPTFQPVECVQSGETCYNLDGEPQDEDGDGWFDGDDPDCFFGGYESGFSSVAPTELLNCDGVCDCNDGQDNDGDGDIDSDDVDCLTGFDDNESDDVSCEDGEDNDGDSWVDGNDPDCVFEGSETGNFAATACNDGLDNDGNGDIDNDDTSCGDAFDTDESISSPRTNNACTDKVDNDGDGWIDNDDSDCGLYSDEAGWGITECNDGLDNDGDGDIDADDVGCTSPLVSEDEADVTCTDTVDNDGDGYVDAEDPDCVLGLVEDNSYFGIYGCNDGIDNDLADDNPDNNPEVEVTIDADDSDCRSAFQGVEAETISNSCTDENGLDEDNDGWINADDPDCYDGGKLERFFSGTVCNDGVDNDGDGDVDADDVGCLDALRSTEEDLPGGSDCDDGVDNDGDSWTDLEDDGCQVGGFELTADLAACADGLDNDGDGDIDGADVDCQNSLDVNELTNDSCLDELDNDGDGWIDLDDTDCSNYGYERGFAAGECSDNVDNDGDGAIDAADPECLSATTRLERQDECSDSVDNDGDGYVDVEDADCILGRDGLEDGAVTNIQCSNGEDDDGDGDIDRADVDCVSSLDNLEQANDPGEPITINYDQADWTAEMSADEDGYDIYYLNAGNYQVNPADEDQNWSLPQEWLSGFASARFASDNFSSFGTGDFDFVHSLTLPNNFGRVSIFVVGDQFFQDFAEEAKAQSDWWAANANEWTGMDPELYSDFNFRVEDNAWRTRDSLTTGLDNWVFRTPNYVRIANGSNVEEGGSVSGDFQIHLVSFDSASAMIVQGSFDVAEIRGDKWTYGSLEDELVERNNTVLCGE